MSGLGKRLEALERSAALVHERRPVPIYVEPAEDLSDPSFT